MLNGSSLSVTMTTASLKYLSLHATLIRYDNILKKITPLHTRRTIPFSAETADAIWGEVFKHDIEEIQTLYRAMRKLTCDTITTFAFTLFAELLYHLSYKRRGRYINESDYMAKKSGILSPAQVAFLQRQYTLAHIGFCTTTTAWDKKRQEMVCMRSLDWQGATEIANCTRLFDFVNNDGARIATVAGIAGMIGVLTGIKQGFSITANYAPWPISATFRTDPTFLIRDLLQDETINSYNAAVKAIKTWKIGAPCFITLCGVSKGDASVIEFGRGRRMYHRQADGDGILVQTNHYAHKPFKKFNKKQYRTEPNSGWYNSKLLKSSQYRQQLILDKLHTTTPEQTSLEARLKEMYMIPPVMNNETAHWVLMRPSNGPLQDDDIKVWTCSDQ